MDSDITNKLNEVLSDPEKLKSVMSVVSTFMGSQSQPQPAQQPVQPPPPVEVFNTKESNSRTELLRALKPFLSEEKCARIDKILKIMTVAQLAGLITNEPPRG